MDDEPLDDLRAAAMTGGAAAARVAEILARDLQTRTQQRQDEQRSQGEGAVRNLRPEEAQTRSWVAPEEENNLYPGWYEERERPEDAAAFETDVAQRMKDLPKWESTYLADLKAAEDKAASAKGPPVSTTYDQQRGQRDATLQALGVPDQARTAKTTADLLNGTDPANAAKSGSKTKATKAAPVAGREPSRGR